MKMSQFVFQICLVILLVWLSSSTSAPINLEEQLQQLTANYKLMEAKLNQLEFKNTQLQIQVQQQNELKEEYAAKMNQFEAKLNEQNLLLTALSNERSTLIDVKPGQSSPTSINGLPSSCGDLKMLGHTLSGVYSIMGTAMVESVFCDFTKHVGDTGFQTWIGFSDVKSSPTYFYVQRFMEAFRQLNTPIPFDSELLNVGGAINKQTGKFTAPVAGRYFFSFAGLVRFTGSTSKQDCGIQLLKNGVEIAKSHTDEISTSWQYDSFSLQSTLHLNEGDEIWLQMSSIATGAYLHGLGYTHFNGFLLEEDISQFVKTLF